MPGTGPLENGDGPHPATQAQPTEPTAGAATSTTASSASTTPMNAPALQLIILGCGGGPLENNTTALLVRSVAEDWQKCSMVAVDAGVHLAAITKILESTQPADLASLPLPHVLQRGPFAGFRVNSASATVNASQIARTMVDTYLITHPHLDHISGFVVNTAGLPAGPRPKRLAGLPTTIDAFRNHVFNDVIWPNLSDENGGVGLVTYTRLVDGGSPAIGEGDARGYLEVADGISVKACSISHGAPVKPPSSQRGSSASAAGTPVRFSSFDAASMTPSHSQQQHPSFHHSHGYHQGNPQPSPRSVHYSPTIAAQGNMPSTPGPRAASYPLNQAPPLPQLPQTSPFADSGAVPHVHHPHVYDSTAYFLRSTSSGSEILIFGDVEPDTLSNWPRNTVIWREAAPKIARGQLRALIIECSYDDSHPSDRMFGHLKPSFLIEEMRNLANEVSIARTLGSRRVAGGSDPRQDQVGGDAAAAAAAADRAASIKKRKRNGSEVPPSLSRRRTGGSGAETGGEAVSPKTVRSRFDSVGDEGSFAHGHGTSSTSASASASASAPAPPSLSAALPDAAASASQVLESPHIATPTAELSLRDIEPTQQDMQAAGRTPSMDGVMEEGDAAASAEAERLPLAGLKVVVIHVKDKLDGADQGAKILEELKEHEARWKTGAEFVVSHVGQSVYV